MNFDISEKMSLILTQNRPSNIFFNAVHTLQVDAGLTTKPETTAVIQSANVNTTVQEQSIIVGDKIISVRIEGK